LNNKVFTINIATRKQELEFSNLGKLIIAPLDQITEKFDKIKLEI
jgi:hypothetical protein